MDSSICSALGWVPDALLVTVEAAMAWRRAVEKAVEKAVKKAVEATAAEATAGRHTLRTLTQGRRRRLRGTSYRRR